MKRRNMEPETILLADPEFVRRLPEALQDLSRRGVTPAAALRALRRSPRVRANVEAVFLLSHALHEGERLRRAPQGVVDQAMLRPLAASRRHFRFALSDLLVGLALHEFNRLFESRGESYETRLVDYPSIDERGVTPSAERLREALGLEERETLSFSSNVAALDALADDPFLRCREIVRCILALGAYGGYARYYLKLLDSLEDPAKSTPEVWSGPASRLPPGELLGAYLLRWANALDRAGQPREAMHLALRAEFLFPGAIHAPCLAGLLAFSCGEERSGFAALERWFERWWPDARVTALYREEIASDRDRWRGIFRAHPALARLVAGLPAELSEAIGSEVL